jgi:hypothetical protein
MPDHHAIRFHAGIFENVELLERGLAGYSRVGKYRNVGRDMRLSYGPENLAFVGCDLVP